MAKYESGGAYRGGAYKRKCVFTNKERCSMRKIEKGCDWLTERNSRETLRLEKLKEGVSQDRYADQLAD